MQRKTDLAVFKNEAKASGDGFEGAEGVCRVSNPTEN